MSLFEYDEMSFYSFGLKTGLLNLLHNRLRLGLRKTLGKITQPINSYTRFPEYHFFCDRIRAFAQSLPGPVRILDVGSPKLFGFYIAAKLNVDLIMSDISTLNIDEYRIMWNTLASKATGRATFRTEDVRHMTCANESFDCVYCMSAIEHVEGEAADGLAVTELMRVLRPGGLLVFSVPAGERPAEQLRSLAGQDHKGACDSRDDFFQRIYTRETLEECLLARLKSCVEEVKLVTVVRKPDCFLRNYLKLGQITRGVLGGLNPLLSARYNSTVSTGCASMACEYSRRHTPSDIYGDFICSCVKSQQ